MLQFLFSGFALVISIATLLTLHYGWVIAIFYGGVYEITWLVILGAVWGIAIIGWSIASSHDGLDHWR